MALKEFRCGAQNSVGIGGNADIQVGPGGLKSGAFDPPQKWRVHRSIRENNGGLGREATAVRREPRLRSSLDPAD
jgi:hypothetical protein